MHQQLQLQQQQLEKHLDSTNLRQRYVIFYAVFARCQHYIWRRFAISGNDKESFNPVMDPDADPDHHHDLITYKLGKSNLPSKFQPNPPVTFSK